MRGVGRWEGRRWAEGRVGTEVGRRCVGGWGGDGAEGAEVGGGVGSGRGGGRRGGVWGRLRGREVGEEEGRGGH